MLCDICDKLNIDGYDTKLLREFVGSHPWALTWKYTFEKPIEENVAREVRDILEMWDWIEISYEQLSEKDRTGIEEYCTFPGFDGNEESEYCYGCRYLDKQNGPMETLFGTRSEFTLPDASEISRDAGEVAFERGTDKDHRIK